MFRKRRSRGGEGTPSSTAGTQDSAARSVAASSHHGGHRAGSRSQGAAEDNGVYPDPGIDRAVTYRVRHGSTPASRSSDHPYGADRGAKRRNSLVLEPSGPNYYTLLGVDYRATSDQVELAFRRLVSRIHPDKFFDDQVRYVEALEQLKDLNAMMRVLRDPVQRARYDAMLTDNQIPPLTRRLAAIHIAR